MYKVSKRSFHFTLYHFSLLSILNSFFGYLIFYFGIKSWLKRKIDITIPFSNLPLKMGPRHAKFFSKFYYNCCLLYLFFTFLLLGFGCFSVHFCTFLRLVACNTRNVKHGYNKHDSTQYLFWLSNFQGFRIPFTSVCIERLREFFSKWCELFSISGSVLKKSFSIFTVHFPKKKRK